MKFRPPQALTVSPLQQRDWPSPHLVAICRPPIPAFPPCRQPNQLGASRPTSASTRKTCCRPTLLFLSMSASTLAPSLNGRPRCSHHVVHYWACKAFPSCAHLRQNVGLEGSTWHCLCLACSDDSFRTIASSAVEALSPFVSFLKVPQDTSEPTNPLLEPKSRQAHVALVLRPASHSRGERR